jgi:hypothetical protein
MPTPWGQKALEDVARAICKSRTCEGFLCCQWPAQGGRTKCPVKDGAYDDAALAASHALIAALENPSFEMREAAGPGLFDACMPVLRAMLTRADEEIRSPSPLSPSPGERDA